MPNWRTSKRLECKFMAKRRFRPKSSVMGAGVTPKHTQRRPSELGNIKAKIKAILDLEALRSHAPKPEPSPREQQIKALRGTLESIQKQIVGNPYAGSGLLKKEEKLIVEIRQLGQNEHPHFTANLSREEQLSGMRRRLRVIEGLRAQGKISYELNNERIGLESQINAFEKSLNKK
ncbi:MAG: hypothetical protein V1494_06270 [Candidatus Diapherotrites archaeon]